ncbi:hypothetical protein [Sandaracinus amylolyticus]|uniref:hypothetical protein n=1 Tax=Sandaracinus amylolyticus TaxID=927083 RepID=UPI001F3353C2|nr:hypothetical protein [Sandaracinus amylolyticus]UJR83204.1 Hypothetical protein I5071_52700 [Sandaracinus amylolyticus]
MKLLHERVAAGAPIIGIHDAEDYLRRAIRKRLIVASNQGRLSAGAHDISRAVRVQPSDEKEGAFDLIGGRRNFGRVRELVDLRMPDGGWLFFMAILIPHADGLEVFAYNCERVYSEGASPRWVRFDYNEDGHRNDERGLRAHMHPGNDDLMLPSPILAPHELLDVFLLGGILDAERKTRTKGEPANS